MEIRLKTFQDVLDSQLDYSLHDFEGNEIINPLDWNWRLLEFPNEDCVSFLFVPYIKIKK